MGSGTHRIKGLRPLGSTIEFEEGLVIINYPSPTTWEADIVIEPDVTEYNYRFISISDVQSPWITVTVTVKSSSPQETQASNTLDFWGMRLDTERLSGEGNVAYRNRLLDVFVHRGGPHHTGLLNAIGRDLSLSYEDQALIIQAKTSPISGLRFNRIIFGISSQKIRVFHPDLVIHGELALVDPVTREVSPTRTVATFLNVSLEDGTVLDYDYDEELNKVYIHGNYASQVVRLSYVYMHVVSRLNKTLSQLSTELEALVTPAGDQIIDVTVHSDYATATAEKLQNLPETVIEEFHLDASGTEVEGIPVRWIDCKLEVVWDPELQNNLRAWTGSLVNTKIDSAFQALVETAKQTWGTAVADDSVWGSTKFPLHGGQHFDSIFDAPLGYWENPITGERFNKWQADMGVDPKTLDTLTYKGILQSEFQSGVGGKNDLRVSLKRHSFQRSGTEAEHNVTDGSEGEIPDDDPMLGVVDLE
jgi:hypothetical protein